MPNFVICPDLLAKYPSRKSVADAIKKIVMPSSGLSGVMRIKNGIRIILTLVSIVGRLNLIVLIQ
jgi:hypothetical protein